MNEKRNGALDRYPIEKKRAGRPSVTVKEDGAVIFLSVCTGSKNSTGCRTGRIFYK